jgi:hypothetical protein
MLSEELFSHLSNLEVSLHESSARKDSSIVDQLLHASFVEFGRSGRRYDRDEILQLMRLEDSHCEVWPQDFVGTVIAEDVVLLTYRSAHVSECGALSKCSLRSSIWQRMPTGWQVRFHQGTPAQAFERKPAG